MSEIGGHMNKKLIVALVVVVVIGGAVWAYFATRPNAAVPQSTADSAQGHEHNESDVQEAPVSGNELTYTDEGFSPSNLSVKVGTSLKIMNKSSGPLQFSSDDHPTHTKHSEFNLMTIQAGEEETLEVKTAGTWGYHNHLKAQDTGTITVKE
jgi:plastocyanin